MAETRKPLPKSRTYVRGFSQPQIPDELHKLLKKAGLKSIHDLDQGYLGSGSQITQKQFLALSVVCPSLTPHSKLLESLDVYGLTKVWNDAVQMVTQSREYQAHLKLVPATPPLHFDHGDPDYPGLFLPVLMSQEQTIRSSDYSQNPTNTTKLGSPEEHKPQRASYFKSIEGRIQKLKSRCFGQVTEDSTSSDEDELYAEDSLEVREEATTNAALMTLLQCVALFVCDSPVQYEDDQKLALIDLKKLGIRHETLELDGVSHTYFSPMDLKTFQTYTIDKKSVSAQDIANRSSRPWNEKVLKSMYGDEDNEDVALQLCSMLEDNFQCLSMKEGQDGKAIYFQEISD